VAAGLEPLHLPCAQLGIRHPRKNEINRPEENFEWPVQKEVKQSKVISQLRHPAAYFLVERWLQLPQASESWSCLRCDEHGLSWQTHPDSESVLAIMPCTFAAILWSLILEYTERCVQDLEHDQNNASPHRDCLNPTKNIDFRKKQAITIWCQVVHKVRSQSPLQIDSKNLKFRMIKQWSNN